MMRFTVSAFQLETTKRRESKGEGKLEALQIKMIFHLFRSVIVPTSDKECGTIIPF
jgi:hypothetical protein